MSHSAPVKFQRLTPIDRFSYHAQFLLHLRQHWFKTLVLIRIMKWQIEPRNLSVDPAYNSLEWFEQVHLPGRHSFSRPCSASIVIERTDLSQIWAS